MPKLDVDAEGNQVVASFGAYPDELARWKKRAREANRSFSAWIRVRLLEADARDEELAARVSERHDG